MKKWRFLKTGFLETWRSITLFSLEQLKKIEDLLNYMKCVDSSGILTFRYIALKFEPLTYCLLEYSFCNNLTIKYSTHLFSSLYLNAVMVYGPSHGPENGKNVPILFSFVLITLAATSFLKIKLFK